MRILLIRHGDPDYENDTLTEKGRREAQLLSESAEALRLGDCFVSPLGRAQATADYTLKKLGLTAPTLDWLQEFPAKVDINDSPELIRAYPDTEWENGRCSSRILWDMLPSYRCAHPEYADRTAWRTSEAAARGDLNAVYDSVIRQFDALLARYGCIRQGDCYRIEKSTEQTLTFFCHFGISCVLLSHLWNVSPFVLWHGLALPPTSVSEIVTEEREQGIASFRALRLGDISHLAAAGEPASFSARFCETYENTEQRH